jgi:hypothetical protein
MVRIILNSSGRVAATGRVLIATGLYFRLVAKTDTCSNGLVQYDTSEDRSVVIAESYTGEEEVIHVNLDKVEFEAWTVGVVQVSIEEFGAESRIECDEIGNVIYVELKSKLVIKGSQAER